MYLKRMWLLLMLLGVLAPAGCSSRKVPAPQTPLIRVKILASQDQVLVTASSPPMVRAQSDATARLMQFPPGQPVQVLLAADGFWRVGNVPAGSGELVIGPPDGTNLLVNNRGYRGAYRLVPIGGGKFDVINDVDLDSYLKGVLSSELLKNWQLEAYKAQAIAARTYALYHMKTDGANRPWDVYDDTRSQVYGGVDAETEKSRQATDETAGVVLAYGPEGEEHIFEAYFSSCCGGISQSAYDALGGPRIDPLSAQNVGALCNASPKFNWGPIVIARPELTRRIKTWGARRENPIKDMGALDRIDIQFVNQFNRPIRFLVTDSRGTSYSLSSEQTRTACNTDAGDGPTLPSSFFKPVVSLPDSIAFVEGHGFGHGVGLCQWCTEARAEQGMSAESILAAAFPKAKLKRAY
jgi:stage II sporulation protein D